MSRILVTGGLGYIGSHISYVLCESNHEVTIIDDLSNSTKDTLGALNQLTGLNVKYINIDLRDRRAVLAEFRASDFDSVIHLAAIKSVVRSIDNPFACYQNNVISTLNVLEGCVETAVKNLIFSSSASIYGESHNPLTESDIPNPLSPYAKSKLQCEQIIRDVCNKHSINYSILRYFNPLGCHSSALLGSSHKNQYDKNILDNICEVAGGIKPGLDLYAYIGSDGEVVSGHRDFVHVMDIANGHVLSLKRLEGSGDRVSIHDIYNLGIGKSISVNDLIRIFEESTGCNIKLCINKLRDGEIKLSCANSDRASTELGWVPRYSYSDMCRDAWNRFKYLHE